MKDPRPADAPAAQPPPSPTVIELHARTGRDRSFDQLYRLEHLAMLRLGFLLTGDRDIAADVVHDAFVRTYERWDRLERPGAYLRTVVVNGCNDHHRRRTRRRTSSVADVPARAEAEGVDLAAEQFGADDVALAQAIAGLQPKRRAAIVLRYYLDLPQREIAETLGVRDGTAKSLVHRGLADLRAALADLEPPGHDGPDHDGPDHDGPDQTTGSDAEAPR